MFGVLGTHLQPRTTTALTPYRCHPSVLSRSMATSLTGGSTSTSSSSSASAPSSATSTAASHKTATSHATTSALAPHIPRNRLRSLLEHGHTVVGSMLADSTSNASLRTLHNAGLDFVIIDNEHGMYTNRQLSDLCTHAVVLGLTPLVRVPDLQYHLVAQSLDGGAQGLVIPRIYTAQQVVDVVKWAKYPPVGVRGNAQWRAYSGWTGGPVVDAMSTMNREILLLFQIETLESVQHMDELLSVAGVDGVLVGPNDLSINLGTPDDWASPAMTAAFQEVIRLCDSKGLIAGIHVSDSAQSIDYARRGFRLVSANSEMGFMAGAANAHVQNVKAALGDKAVDGAWRGRGGKAGY